MKKVLKPEIRFKGFTDAWIQCKVGELFFIDTGNSKLTKQYIKQNLGKYPVYSSQTENNGIIGYINTYDFDGEFITWTQDGNAGKVFYRNGRFNASNSGILTLNFPSKYNLKFLFLALIFLDLTKLQIGGTVPHFTASMMRKVIFLIPKNKVEQEKISSIFFTLDKIVSLYQRKISVLEKLEKAFLKNMFTKKNEAKPNIRFKD
ncbi:restriction endonuclease subunit S, partial [Mesomycoplasma hyorhinis]